MNIASSLSSRKRKLQNEGRAFNERWTDNYFFIEYKDALICLICTQTVACLKEYNLKRHFDTKHASIYKKYIGQADRMKYAD